MKFLAKHDTTDKFDGAIAKDKVFIHTNRQICGECDSFHIEHGRAWIGRAKSFRFGINKSEYHAAGCSILIDGHYVGKSER